MKKFNFRKIAVIAVLSQVFLYTWAHLILSALIGIEITPTTSVAFYSFCGAEAGFLAFIQKLSKQHESEESEYEKPDYSEIDEP